MAAALTVVDLHLMPSDHGTGDPGMGATVGSDAAHTATVGSTPEHRHGLPGHLWAVCLAVLAAGLALLLVLGAPGLLRRASQAAVPAWLRGQFWPSAPRPPGLSSLCVLRT